MKDLLFKTKIPLVCSLVILLLTGCSSIRLITAYDEVTYATINALQEKTTTFFVDLNEDLGTPEADYINHKAFYHDARVMISTLKLRANAMEKNEIVIGQINLLEENFNTLAALDKKGFKNLNSIELAKRGMDMSLTAMIKLQLALRRGKSK